MKNAERLFLLVVLLSVGGWFAMIHRKRLMHPEETLNASQAPDFLSYNQTAKDPEEAARECGSSNMLMMDYFQNPEEVYQTGAR